MRRTMLLLAALTTAVAFAPTASAHAARPSDQAAADCEPPLVIARYHPDRFSVHAVLATAGCPARQTGDTFLTVWLSRTDEHTGSGHGRVAACPPDDDVCEVDLEIPHPDPEAASYDLEVSYTGADGRESMESHSHCTTGPDGAYCVRAD